jgi:hypothetical protein
MYSVNTVLLREEITAGFRKLYNEDVHWEISTFF